MLVCYRRPMALSAAASPFSVSLPSVVSSTTMCPATTRTVVTMTKSPTWSSLRPHLRGYVLRGRPKASPVAASFILPWPASSRRRLCSLLACLFLECGTLMRQLLAFFFLDFCRRRRKDARSPGHGALSLPCLIPWIVNNKVVRSNRKTGLAPCL